TYGRGVFEFTTAQGPVIAVNMQDGLDFGTVCVGGRDDLTLQIFNVGTADLVISAVQRLMGSANVIVLSMPGTPLVIAPGEEVDFTVRYTPTVIGATDIATIRIESNDPTAPVVDLLATAFAGTGLLATAIPDRGNFGEVCSGSFVDRDIVLNNTGTCDLRVLNIISSDTQFIAPQASYPILIAPGDSVSLPLRFQPAAFGAASATVTIITDSIVPDRSVRVNGTCPPPRLITFLPDAGKFGRVCACSFRDEPLTISNVGHCLLTVSGISSTSDEFLTPDIDVFPLTVAPGTATQVPIRFRPETNGRKSAIITVLSDDPAGPRAIDVSGYAPHGALAVTGSTDFGKVKIGMTAQTQITLANVGDCDLHVCRVAFRSVGCCGCGAGGSGCGRCGCRDHRKRRHEHCDHHDNHHHDQGHHHDHDDHHHDDDRCHHGKDDHDEEQRHAESDHREDRDRGRCDFCHNHDRQCGTCQCCGDFRLAGNPFPTTLRPGSSVPLTIAFTPTDDCKPCCELVICTNEPDHERTSLLVTGRHLPRHRTHQEAPRGKDRRPWFRRLFND
ncbi:MAG: choice-of-anchor D domain-containing protein, partial [Streptosporangiaceae bacterium]